MPRVLGLITLTRTWQGYVLFTKCMLDHIEQIPTGNFVCLTAETCGASQERDLALKDVAG